MVSSLAPTKGGLGISERQEREPGVETGTAVGWGDTGLAWVFTVILGGLRPFCRVLSPGGT